MNNSPWNVPQNINGAQYYEPLKGRLYDTESNMNFVNIHQPIAPERTPEEVIKSLIKQARNFWLETYWKDLYAYVIVEKGRCRLISSKHEYKQQKKNIYDGFLDKKEFLKDKFLGKSSVKKMLKKVVGKIPYSDSHEYEKMVRKGLHHQLKKKLVHKIKSDL